MYSTGTFTENQILGSDFWCTNEQRFIPAEQVNSARHYVEFTNRFGESHAAKDIRICPHCGQLLNFGPFDAPTLIVRY